VSQTINGASRTASTDAPKPNDSDGADAATNFQNHLLANAKRTTLANLDADPGPATPPRRRKGAAAPSPKPNSTSLPNALPNVGGIPGMGMMGGIPGMVGMPGMGGMGGMPGMNGMGMMGGIPGMGGMGMPGMGGLGMPGMGMGMPGLGFNPQRMILGSFFKRAGELDILLATGKISPKQFFQNVGKLLLEYKATMFQMHYPLLNLLRIGFGALFASNKRKKGVDPFDNKLAAPGATANQDKSRAASG
jgi:hypothetical protein